MHEDIDSLHTGIFATLIEVPRPDRTSNHRTNEILAFFERPNTSNGPTNGRRECLRGSALCFHNLINHGAGSRLETGRFRHHLHLQER